MEFEWDEAKRARVFRERGIDLVRAARIFRGRVLVEADRRRDYGEDRYIAIGEAGGESFVVTFTHRGQRIRLITAWRAGARARAAYQERFPG
ncbi:BrnT family toxin [Xanthobacter sp. KR7-225]|uniref:BrnT family toxin n=1 Tax=Xanthobacter sp. KR7-225 TaxID=3156613 RepID=UPI0032B58E2C